MSLSYISKVNSTYRSEFEQKVKDVSSYLGSKPDWLMQIMYSESGLNPKARNIQSGHVVATGLIQWTNAALSGTGVTQDDIYNMTALQQLDLVKKYYAGFKGRIKSYFDMYLITFFPAAIGKPDSWVFQTSNLSAGLIASQNKSIDINKDGKITVAEFKQYVKNTVPASLQSIIFGSPAALVVLAIISLIAIFLNK